MTRLRRINLKRVLDLKDFDRSLRIVAKDHVKLSGRKTQLKDVYAAEDVLRLQRP